MSSSSLIARSWLVRWARLACAMACVGALSACSFSPVYSTSRTAETVQLDFPEPTSRLQQIIYQELAFRLGSTEDPSAPDILITVSTSSASIGRTTSGAQTPNEMKATASVTVTDPTRDGETITSFTRVASASFETIDQALSNQAAVREAQERAVKAVAESVRVKLLADLTR